MIDVPLSEQLDCARRELRYRIFVYPRMVREARMTDRSAKQEIERQTAIVQTLIRLVKEEQRRQQPELWPSTGGTGRECLGAGGASPPPGT